MKIKLIDYCKERNISIDDLAEITGVSRGTLYKIDAGANVTIDIINNIYTGTLKKFGVGLIAELYTDIYKK